MTHVIGGLPSQGHNARLFIAPFPIRISQVAPGCQSGQDQDRNKGKRPARLAHHGSHRAHAEDGPRRVSEAERGTKTSRQRQTGTERNHGQRLRKSPRCVATCEHPERRHGSSGDLLAQQPNGDGHEHVRERADGAERQPGRSSKRGTEKLGVAAGEREDDFARSPESPREQGTRKLLNQIVDGNTNIVASAPSTPTCNARSCVSATTSRKPKVVCTRRNGFSPCRRSCSASRTRLSATCFQVATVSMNEPFSVRCACIHMATYHESSSIEPLAWILWAPNDSS